LILKVQNTFELKVSCLKYILLHKVSDGIPLLLGLSLSVSLENWGGIMRNGRDYIMIVVFLCATAYGRRFE
jgi:hypothetical protein